MSSDPSSELIEALRQHDLERVRSLLAHGADPNAANLDGGRPLHIILGEGNALPFVKLLLSSGADPNGWDLNHHETPLLGACDPPYADVEVARALLKAGADPNVKRSEGECPRGVRPAADLLRDPRTHAVWGRGPKPTLE